MPKIAGKITQAVMARLTFPAGAEEVTYWDGQLPGFGVRLRQDKKTGAIRAWFYVQYRNGAGIQHKYPIGFYGAPWTADEARSRARELLRDTQQGIDPATAAKRRRAEQSLADAVEAFLEDRASGHKALAEGTIRDYRALFRNHVIPELGSRKVSEVAREDVQSIRTKLARDGRARTGDKVVLLIKSLYAWLNDQGLQVASPADSLKVAPTRHAAHAVRDDQLGAVLEALREESNSVARDFLMVAMFTGARRANVLAMRWEHLNLTAGQWFMPTTKNGAPLTVTLPSVVVALLRDRQRESLGPWVFPGTGATGHFKEPFKAWERVQRRAEMHLLIARLASNGIDARQEVGETTKVVLARLRAEAEQHRVDTMHTTLQLRIHDLRATFATVLAAGGQSTVTIAQMLGQKTLAMAHRYTQLQAEHKQHASNAAEARILVAAGLRPSGEIVELAAARKA